MGVLQCLPPPPNFGISFKHSKLYHLVFISVIVYNKIMKYKTSGIFPLMLFVFVIKNLFVTDYSSYSIRLASIPMTF